MSTQWDPSQYLRFEDERSRPFGDLLARVRHPAPAEVVDLGCGPANMTMRLRERWPGAHILGLDSSAEMIARAGEHAVPGHLEFRRGDLREWEPDRPVDVILSCATLQWVPRHLDLFPRFIGSLAPGGMLAFHVPANFDQPSHVLLNDLAMSKRWKGLLAGAVAAGPASAEPAEYLSDLFAAGATSADVWDTTYFHVLEGPDAVLQWVQATGLRPVLAALDEQGAEGERQEFLSAYAAALNAAYPRDAQNRTIFPFRRVFAVASGPA